MKQESGHIDALTNFFGYAYGSKKIDEVLQRGGGHDTALLFQVDNWEGFCELAGDKAADFSLAKLSFLLTKLFHKTDIFVRIAPAAFLYTAMATWSLRIFKEDCSCCIRI
ncbi:hypothetical protein HMPREF0983_03204 [Erysipelotrichaceae bacterium 3_1_53]|nr:hypothetical protein HMPREF0983_03204 [Erysipelotrichaceae bacterium 3_1_53]